MALGNVPKPKLPTDGNPGKTDGKWKQELRTHTARVVSWQSVSGLAEMDAARDSSQIWSEGNTLRPHHLYAC